jgi:hypothetical protein
MPVNVESRQQASGVLRQIKVTSTNGEKIDMPGGIEKSDKDPLPRKVLLCMM